MINSLSHYIYTQSITTIVISNSFSRLAKITKQSSNKMTSSPLIPFRSISLPARFHPNSYCEPNLQKLKSGQNPKTALIISIEALQAALLDLAELYSSVKELAEKPSTQQSVSLQGNLFEESVLEGSVELLDSCNAIREVFQMIKENVQSLQSALRRKGRDSSIQSDITSYFSFRRKMNSSISKSLKKLKSIENRTNGSSNRSVYVDEDLIMTLRERTRATIATFKSILMYLSSPVPKNGGWNLVATLMMKRSENGGKDQSVTGEVGSVDSTLAAKTVDVQTALRSLQNLDSCIEGLESGVDRLFRQLIQCRVTLLNILTDL